jgi:glutamate/tyrosine decarboxylase-like PLP-dependent enzyme
MYDTLFRPTLSVALESALGFLNGLEETPVAAPVDLTTLRRRLGRKLEAVGVQPDIVVRDLVADVSGAIMGSAGGRFFGWVIGGTLPSALAADWLTAAWDQNAALYSCGAAAAIVEEVAGEWLKDLLGLPATASFAFVTGTQMSHFTCLAAARHALLARRGWDVEERGLYQAPPIRILCNDQRHGSIDRALSNLGLGRSRIVGISTDVSNRIITESLEAALADGADSPTIVILQAGDICTGAFDDFERLIPLSHRHGAWVHVDGAFGLWASASTHYRYLAKGVALADSWTTDGHKWLNVPYDCGYAFVANSNAHFNAMSHRATYLTHDGQARDQIDWNPEWSRRARGFPTYAALRQLGRQGIGELIERCCQHARTLVTGLALMAGVEILSEAILNQALVRFLDPQGAASDADHDRRTDAVISAVADTGEAFFSATTWHGIRAMRISVCNWRTSAADIQRTLNVFATVLKQPLPTGA